VDLAAIKQLVPVGAKSRVKIGRASIARRLGSDRYQTPAINGLDRQMLDRLPPRGTFLEIGANDGYTQSNTYFLAKHRGWTGVLIEPLPRQFALCRSHRKESVCFNVACVGPDGPDQIDLVDRHLMSSVADDGANNAITVRTALMSDLIESAGIGAPTFMSIDVEGAELGVLSGLRLDEHCPRFLLVETSVPDSVAELLHPFLTWDSQLSFHDHLFVPAVERQ